MRREMRESVFRLLAAMEEEEEEEQQQLKECA